MTLMTSEDINFDKRLSAIEYQMGYLVRAVDDIKLNLKNDYVKRDEFLPIQKLMYGMVSIVLISVVGALIALVLKK